MRRAFTLIEVNLAMLIMAGGILAMVSLYSLGYRENSQSREDVAGAALADAVMSPIVMAASATNLKWSVFSNLNSDPNNGWAGYLNTSTGLVSGDPEGKAEGVFNGIMGKLYSGVEGTADFSKAFPSAARNAMKLKCGLVVMHEQGSPVLRIAFRSTRQANLLLSMPLYYTEVRFQGVVDQP